ncbi:unnamed protein product [Sphagnum balticum]
MHVASCLKVHCSEARRTVTCEDQDSEDNSVFASAASAFCSKVDFPIGGLKCDRTVDKAVDMLDKKQDYYTTEEECTSEHGLRGHVRAHSEAAFVDIQEDTHIDNTTSSSSTPSSFSVESPDSNTSNPGGLLNLESSSETHLIISAGNKPEEVRRQPVVSEKAKFDNMFTASYTDAILKKLACYARTTVSLNSHQNLTSQNGQNGAKKISSQEESWDLFDYFMDFLASRPKRLDLDMIKTHKLHANDAFGEFSMETNSLMAHVKCVDSRLADTNNSLLLERQPKLQVTDTGDSNWELAKQDSGQHSQPNIIPNSEISSQVIGDQFWEKGNSLTCCCNSPRKHLSSFKFGETKTAEGELENITTLEVGHIKATTHDFKPAFSHARKLPNQSTKLVAENKLSLKTGDSSKDDHTLEYGCDDNNGQIGTPALFVPGTVMTLAEATDKILFCSSIMHDLVYATVAISDSENTTENKKTTTILKPTSSLDYYDLAAD